jgi:hypothetical protein
MGRAEPVDIRRRPSCLAMSILTLATARISREATRDRLRYEFGGPLLYKWLIYYAGFRFDEFF